ncbi:MAG: TRAP transporter large permease subunit [Deltaproteobacteria bacterium]|jgi:tripartite ATP-independent transporter DctM subunit|nr:TRAP transporter large permease subunit [Deltaproteobacteria bacterium]MBW2530376.1 TRAP transporter large permease subunit [Deltaproteobacteria bacterium]
MFKILAIILAALAVVGMPLFAVLGGISILSWLSADDPNQRFVRFIAANVLDDKFSGSVILVTIPLFTFVGYLMAESKTPDRMVRAASAALGWMPGGLAIVCILASAFFTTLTGGSGVTIVAIGGLLYPVLVKQGYPKKFALGLVTTAGAMGLLFPPSPLVLIYGFVSGVDIKRAYTATMFPGLFLIVVVSLYAVWVGKRSKVPTQKFVLREVGATVWEAKWDLFAPFLVLLGLGTGLMALDESAAAAALYTVIVQVYIYRDLTWRRVVKVARDAMSLAGAIIVILAMATALTNYVIQAGIPQDILAWFTEKGMSEAWHFIIVLNIFLFILGMLMDAFSALLVALPLLIPLAAAFGLHPFYLAVMFLLNLEIAYVTPPVGLNLYISSFRFRRPVVEIYRVVLPFVGLLALGLVVVILYPPLSDFTVKEEIAELKADAKKRGVPPREAWALECVQEDRNNVKPCAPEDIETYGADGRKPIASPDGSAAPDAPPPEDNESMDDMLDEFFDDEDEGDGEKKEGATGAAPTATAAASGSSAPE